MKKQIIVTGILLAMTSASLQAFDFFGPDLTEQLSYNKAKIKQYEQAIDELKKHNDHLEKEIAKNPELYVKKPLYEENKKAYIYRVKLNGAKTDALNFVIKNNRVLISMNVTNENKSDQGYFYSSRQFAQEYAIPKDVKQDKITHTVEGDYFTITMPKK